MMKKILLIILGLFIVMVGAERMVLGEMFTSTTCGPCVSGNATLTGLLSQKGDYLAVVRYHMYWPGSGNDPWYNYNKTDNNGRRGFYGFVNYVPRFVIDGTDAEGSGQSAMWGTKIDDRHGQDSPFRMDVYRTYQSAALEQGEGNILVTIENEGEEEISSKVYGALTESNVAYVGDNGDPVHNQVMLDMLDFFFGSDVTLGPGEIKTMGFDFHTNHLVPVLDGGLNPTGDTMVTDPDNCELVFWCQDFTTKEVFQAAKVAVPGDELPLSVSGTRMVDNSGDDVLEADETAEIHVTLTNDDSKKKTNVRAILQVDNDDIIVENAAAEVGSLNAGQSLTLDGGELSIKAGPDYDGAFFTITVYAGADDGTYGFEAKSSGVEEKSNNDAALSIPSIARTGSALNFATNSALSGFARVEIFDAAGRCVANLYNGPASELSEISLPDVCSGLYFIRVETETYVKTARIVLLD
jgi:hypothetical protein